MTTMFQLFFKNVQMANLSENNPQNNNDDKIRRFFDQARALMVCATCKGNLLRVYQCSNGHPVCIKCLSHDIMCSICRKSIYFGKCTILDNFVDCLLQEDIIKAYERMTEILECSVCYERVAPSFNLCNLGHLVCKSCRKRIVLCPLCNNNFTEEKNKFLDELVDNFPFRCCYYDKGCSVIENYTDIIEHEEKCFFKEYKCQMPLCLWRGKESEIISHVEEKHTDVVIRSNEHVKLKFGSVSSRQPKVVWKITNLVPAYGKYFWQHFRFVNGRVIFITLITGSKEEANQYKVIIRGKFWSIPYTIYSEESDLSAFFYVTHPQAYDISYMMKSKLMGVCPFGMSMEYDYRIMIRRSYFGILCARDIMEILGLTVITGLMVFLFSKMKK